MCGPAADLLARDESAAARCFRRICRRRRASCRRTSRWGWPNLLARGFVTCDSFAALRQMITPPSRRRHALSPVGRWCCFRSIPPAAATPTQIAEHDCPAIAPADRRRLPPHAGSRENPGHLVGVAASLSADGAARRNPRRPVCRPDSPANNLPCPKPWNCSAASAAKARASRSRRSPPIRSIFQGFSRPKTAPHRSRRPRRSRSSSRATSQRRSAARSTLKKWSAEFPLPRLEIWTFPSGAFARRGERRELPPLE